MYQRSVNAPAVARAHEVLDPAILHWGFEPRCNSWSVPEVKTRRIGSVTVSHVSGGPCLGWRDKEMVALDNPDLIGITCTLTGSERCIGKSGERIISAGDISFFRSREELSFEVLDWSSKLVILTPRSKMGANFGGDQLPGNGYVSHNSPMGVLVSGLLTSLSGQIDHMDDREAELSLENALDLVGKAITVGTTEPGVSRTTLFKRVKGFIDRYLKEDLSPATIAAAHGISVRYLHLLFSREGTTVSSWIRERRLMQCKEEISFGKGHTTLTEIAQRWRFCDSAHFSREFKKRFGLSPKQWRNGDMHHAIGRGIPRH